MADNSTFVILREAGELLHENCVTFERMEKVAAEREEVVKSLERENQKLRDILTKDLADVLSTLSDIRNHEAYNLDVTKKQLEELQAVKKVRALHENVTRVSEMNKKLARDNALLNGALMAAHNDLLGSVPPCGAAPGGTLPLDQ